MLDLPRVILWQSKNEAKALDIVWSLEVDFGEEMPETDFLLKSLPELTLLETGSADKARELFGVMNPAAYFEPELYAGIDKVIGAYLEKKHQAELAAARASLPKIAKWLGGKELAANPESEMSILLGGGIVPKFPGATAAIGG